LTAKAFPLFIQKKRKKNFLLLYRRGWKKIGAKFFEKKNFFAATFSAGGFSGRKQHAAAPDPPFVREPSSVVAHESVGRPELRVQKNRREGPGADPTK
jgi:hypothetical protein